jgi:xanthine dehydrogenase YagR molybdenum-binding subunit
MFGPEVALDELAGQLGIDPVELRIRRDVRIGDTRYPVASVAGGSSGTNTRGRRHRRGAPEPRHDRHRRKTQPGQGRPGTGVVHQNHRENPRA